MGIILCVYAGVWGWLKAYQLALLSHVPSYGRAEARVFPQLVYPTYGVGCADRPSPGSQYVESVSDDSTDANRASRWYEAGGPLRPVAAEPTTPAPLKGQRLRRQFPPRVWGKAHIMTFMGFMRPIPPARVGEGPNG
jgi:hypothetical protein